VALQRRYQRHTSKPMNDIVGKNISLRPVQLADAAFVLSLRMDPDRSRFVSPVSGDVQAQTDWISRYKLREADGIEYYFIIELAGSPVGTVRLYDFQGDSFCWGSWMITPGAPASTSIESALLVYEFAFYKLGFRKSHFDVRIENERVVAFHLRFGAEIQRSDELNHFFTYQSKDYEAVRQKYSRFLSREIAPTSSSR
jgi:RimJ/RimL family protein N-acetyltransferase